DICPAEELRTDGPPGGVRAEDEPFQVRHLLQRQLGEVLPVRIAVERGVDVRPRVAHHLNPTDVEGGALSVMSLRSLPAEVVGDDRTRQARIGHHPVLHHVTQIDQPPHGPSPRLLGLLPWCWPGRCDRAIRHRWGDSLLFRKNLECDLTEWSWMSPARWPHVLWRYSLIWTRPRGLWLGHAAPVPPTFSGGSPRKVILLCLNRGMLWVEVGCRRLPFPALDPARSCLKDE